MPVFVTGRQPSPKRPSVRPTCLVLEDRLAPAIVVNTFADETVVEPGATQLISLREAITAVNLGLVPDNTITFARPGVYRLTLGDALDLTHPVKIIGNTTGNGTIIDGLFLDRIFEAEAGASSVSISGVTLRNGLATHDNGNPAGSGANGGAIVVRTPGDSLALTNVKILSCKAVGSTTGSNTGNNEGNGGALFTAGSVSLVGCTLSFNKTTGNTKDFTGGSGGALFAAGSVSLDSTTISQNTTDTANGLGSGGGVFASGALTLTNGTLVTKNTAVGTGGGIFDAASTVALTNSHVDRNTSTAGGTGGIWALKDVTLTGTGSGTSSADHNKGLGGFPNPGGGGIFSVGGTVSLTNSSASFNSTMGFIGGGGILALGDVTLVNSHVDNNSDTGFGGGGGAPIGGGAAGPLTGDAGGGIYAADGNVSLTNSTADFNSTTGFGGGIVAAVGAVTLNHSHADGNTAGAFTVAGGIFAESGVTLTASSTVDNNRVGAFSSGGGVVSVMGDVNVTNSHVDGNTASGTGGGILMETAAPIVNLTNSTVSGNQAGGAGGGIFTPGDVNVLGTGTTSLSHVDNNVAAFAGGIFATGKLTATLATVSGNQAAGSAGGIFDGGIFAGGGGVSLSMTTVANNVAGTAGAGSGGGLLLAGFTTSSISQCTISGNQAIGGVGGGIDAASGVAGALLTITNSTIGQNVATGDGGGLWSSLTGGGGADVVLLYCTFNLNSAAGSGGFDGNTGGSVFVAAGDVQLEDTIAANSGPGVVPPGSPQALDVAAGATITSAGHNLTDDVHSYAFLNAALGDLFTSNARLGPLANRGSCPNKTYALLAGSPAIGHGDGVAPAFDECGVAREQAPLADDIGAYEV